MKSGRFNNRNHAGGRNYSNTKRLLLIGIVLALFIFSGCADMTVRVHRHLYKPDIPKALAGIYKGQQIDLNSFENLDEKTRKWTYYSPDKKVAYEAAVPLEYYALDCFRDAFWVAGMGVLKESPDTKIPDMSLIIDRWTDQEFKFTVTVTKNNMLKFRNQFAVLMPSAGTKDPAQLEKNAYEMMNKAAVAVMSDPNFQAVFK